MAVRNKSSGNSSLNGSLSTSWDNVAGWYDRHVGAHGNEHQRLLAIPAVLELLSLSSGESVLDIGAGQGVLAPFIAEAGACYTGIDSSERLVRAARRRHGALGRFLSVDARRLQEVKELKEGSFDAAVFLLSLQDMDPLVDVLRSAAWSVRAGGRLVVLMTHPCFRVPRQSGWGWDSERKLQYRRIDRYLTPLAVPMAPHVHGRKGTATKCFHRPLSAYAAALADTGFVIDSLQEIAGLHSHARRDQTQACARPNTEIPLFLALRALKRCP